MMNTPEIQALIATAEQLVSNEDYISAALIYDDLSGRSLELNHTLENPFNQCLVKALQHAQQRVYWQHFDRFRRLYLRMVENNRGGIGEINLALDGIQPRHMLQIGKQFELDLTLDKNIKPYYPKRQAIAKKSKGKKIKLGFLGCDFFKQATSLLLTEVISHLDRSQFEVIAFDYGTEPQDDYFQRALKAYDAILPIHELSDAEAAALIYENEIDILFNLKSFALGRMGIFPYRAAPIQVNYLYFPSSTGMSFFDAIVVDKMIVPPELEYAYSEQLWFIEGCYQPNDEQRAIPADVPRSQWGIPDGVFVLGNVNQSYKYTPDCFDWWARVLIDCPNSVLVLLEPKAPFMKENIAYEFNLRGMLAHRLVFVPLLDVEPHIARLRAIDLIIDTTPCGGHTLTSEALWAGTPVVSLMGDTFASRVAGSLLTSVNLPELITHTPDQYVGKIKSLINAPAEVTRMRKHLDKNRKKFELFNSKLYAKRFGDMILQYAVKK